MVRKIPLQKEMATHSSMLLLSHFSRVRLCATPQTAAHQASLSLGFSRQEHWSGVPLSSLLLKSRSPLCPHSYYWSPPNHFQFGAALLKQMFAQINLKILTCPSLSFNMDTFHQCGTLVTVDEPILQYFKPKSIVYTRAHFMLYTLCVLTNT